MKTWDHDNDSRDRTILHLDGLTNPIIMIILIAILMIAMLVTAFGAPVKLQWDANSASDAVTGYHVYRSATQGTAYVKLTMQPVTATEYTDNPSGPGPHYYVVTAVNSAGESGFSNEIEFRQVPAAPRGLRIAPVNARTWPEIERDLDLFAAAMMGINKTVDETQMLAWWAFGPEIIVAANRSNSESHTDSQRNVLTWARQRNLIVIDSGGNVAYPFVATLE